MKGLIVCAGKGSRLYPFTLSYPKTLLPVANVPLLRYGIEKLAEAGIKEIGIVLNTSQEQLIKDITGNGEQWGVQLSYIYQNEPQGIADAVKQAKSFLEDSPFILLLGDNLITESLIDLKAGIEERGSYASVMLAAVTNPQDYGVAELRGNVIIRLQEKPRHPKSNLAILGAYSFNPIIFEAIDTISPSHRGEYEITDAIQWLIDNGYSVARSFAAKPVIDVGTIGRWLEANRCMLELKTNGGVYGERCHLQHTLIIPPVIIGQGCEIKNCTIGPYVSVGNDSILEGCSISNSIILANVNLLNIPYPVKDTVYGPHSIVAGLHGAASTDIDPNPTNSI